MAFTDPVTGVAVVDNANRDGSYVDWAAIIGGVVLASAITVLLLAFGSALGLSLASPYKGEGASGSWLAIAAGLWLIWVQISGFFAGAYLTGRLRRRFHDSSNDEKEIRDGSHGLLVWALGLLLGAWITASGILGAASTATDAASAVAAGGAVAGATAVANADEGTGSANDLYIDRLFRGDKASSVRGGTRNEITRILATTVGDGKLDDGDRAYMVKVVQSEAGVDEAEATKRVDQMVASIDEAEKIARDAAETARIYSILVAFMTAASLLVSAAVAYFAAGLGGKHRDEGTFFVGGWR